MGLTREFKKTMVERAQRDPHFHKILFAEAITACLAGDTVTGKALLRDLVNATVGFEALALAIRKPGKSLHRMLARRGNPGVDTFFQIVTAIQKKTRITLRVTTKAN